MATVAMASAAGAAFLLYYSGWADWPSGKAGDSLDEGEENETPEQKLERLRKIRMQLRMPSRPPASWGEALSMLAEALRFTYSETLGKWPIADLAFGINFMLRRQVGHSRV